MSRIAHAEIGRAGKSWRSVPARASAVFRMLLAVLWISRKPVNDGRPSRPFGEFRRPDRTIGAGCALPIRTPHRAWPDRARRSGSEELWRQPWDRWRTARGRSRAPSQIEGCQIPAAERNRLAACDPVVHRVALAEDPVGTRACAAQSRHRPISVLEELLEGDAEAGFPQAIKRQRLGDASIQ